MLDFARSKEQLFEKYNTSYEGLSSQEARRRLNDFGTNEIASAQKRTTSKSTSNSICSFLPCFWK
jgi:Cation transport ATPase